MEDIIRIFKEIRNTNSRNEKERIIKANNDNETFRRCLSFLLDGNITSYISEKKWNSVGDKHIDYEFKEISGKEFCNLLTYIANTSTGKTCDVALCKAFIQDQTDEFKEFVKGMITKSVKLGVDSKTANKCIPGLIPEHEVALATPIDKCKLTGNEWISISQKLNGIRASQCNGRMISRQGKLLTGLDHILDDLTTIHCEDMFIDGELVYRNKEGLSDSEAFQVGCGIANSKETDKSNLKLVIFDMFPMSEYRTGKSVENYSKRRKWLNGLRELINHHHLENITVVPMFYEGTDHSEIWKWLDYAEENDMEGIVLNLDTPYQIGRTKNLIKVKKFNEIDLRCTAVNIATTGKYKGIMGSITCKFSDNTVDVGSGFNDEQRKYFTEHPDEVVGKVVAVKYKEITTAKGGNRSLQFPVFVTVRDESDKSIADDE